jgi:hypothetical protein
VCKYRYRNNNTTSIEDSCLFPQFFIDHKDKFKDKLLIDNEGYCLFHSKNNQWKIENKFKDRFLELLKIVTETNTKIDKQHRIYQFAGFIFPQYDTLIIDGLELKGSINLTDCTFNCSISFQNITISSLDVERSNFKEKVSFNNVEFINSIYASNAIFQKGLLFTNCKLERNLYFENCMFHDEDKQLGNYIGIIDCEHVHYLNFKGSVIKPRVIIARSNFNYELNFDQCLINDEFSLEKCELNGTISFKESEFLVKENSNPMMSSVHFSENLLTKKGKLIFIGKSSQDDMVKNELSIHFKEKPEGLILFENFNLNKLYSSFKIKIPELEKEGVVEIGKGCRKYNCTTDTITIKASNSNQKLILDIVTVFCNFFEIEQGYSLGVEIIERSKTQIKYFYFTDELITKEEFLSRIKQNEINIWQTFSNLTKNVSDVTSQNNIEIKNCLIDLAGLFLKIGNQLEHNNLLEKDFNNIFNSITVNDKSIIDTESLLQEILSKWKNFNRNVPILKIENMGNTYNNYGRVEQFGENNYKKVITNNSSITEEQKGLILKTIDEIKDETLQERKESRLAKFIKEYGPVIGDTAIKMIRSMI